MFPIYLRKLRTGDGMSVRDFVGQFKEICHAHQVNGRASSFAFILHDFRNPEVTKVLDDKDYFHALNLISGNNLTVFYLHISSEKDKKVNSLYGERSIYDLAYDINNFIVKEFEIDERIELPAILFFQVKNKEIIDFFFCSLKERTIEQSFLEIESLIANVASTIERVLPENRQNHPEVFDLIKNNITGINTIKTIKSRTNKVYKFGKIIVFIEDIVSLFV